MNACDECVECCSRGSAPLGLLGDGTRLKLVDLAMGWPLLLLLLLKGGRAVFGTLVLCTASELPARARKRAPYALMTFSGVLE